MIGKPAGLVVLALLLGSFFTTVGQTESGNVTLEAYWRTLEEIRTELRSDPGLSQPARSDLAGRLDAITSVELPDGVRLPLDHRFLSGLLRAEPPDTTLPLAILDQVFAYKNSRGEARFRDADLNALAAILAGSDYRWPEPAAPNPLTELWQRILNGFLRLLARLAPGANAGAILNTVLLVGIAVVLGIILRYVYVNSIRSVIREAEIDPVTGIPPDLTADRAFEQARYHAEAGDRREAVRYLYLAAMLVLEARGHIRLDRAHTNRELLADLSPRPEIAARFRSVIETFDRVWYGFQSVSQDDFRRYTEAVSQLRNM